MACVPKLEERILPRVLHEAEHRDQTTGWIQWHRSYRRTSYGTVATKKRFTIKPKCRFDLLMPIVGETLIGVLQPEIVGESSPRHWMGEILCKLQSQAVGLEEGVFFINF